LLARLVTNRFLGEKGQGIVEYALVLAFVAVIGSVVLTNNAAIEKIESTFADMVQVFEQVEE